MTRATPRRPRPRPRMTIKSGAIDGEVATAWKQKLADETKVKEARALAEGGNGDAMYCIGLWYYLGTMGLAKDMAQARAWYERSAAARDPRGMGAFGECLLLGFGGSEETSLGLVNVTEAAYLGSDHGAMKLGRGFYSGFHGLPKDPIRARYWLQKVVDGCKFKCLSGKSITDAAEMLRELDEQANELEE